jgi:hypothetical protein
MLTPFAESEFLTLRVGGSPKVPERLLLIGRPRDGLVRVREWTSNSWNTEGEDSDIPASALLEQIEAAYDDRLPVSEEMFKVRHWLQGTR